ncbi:MAG: LysR family transcriptional regulator [Alphaproteobacteria bacterium]
MHAKYSKSFIMVADSGSFSKAADKLFITRSALIQQINNFEYNLGFKLFIRHNRGVSLTPAGKYFYDKTKEVITQSNSIIKHCQRMDGNSQDIVRIGTLTNFSPVLLEKVCHKYNEIYPHIDLQFTEYPLKSYFRHLVNGDFDITTEYMFGYFFEQPGYKFLKLTEDKHCCGLSHEHPLAHKKELTLEDLKGQRLIMYAKGITKADDQLREYIIRNEPEIELIDIKKYDSSLALKCTLDKSVLVFYSMYWQSFPSLASIPLDVDFSIDIGLGYRADCSDAVRQFIEVAQDLFV